MVEAGTFRQDLYYRISPFPILLPSLAERRADIVPLARRLLQQLSQDRPRVLSAASCDWLEQQQFPGNIRELRNRLERATILWDDREIEPRHLTKQLGISERTLYRKLANARSNPQDNPDATTADKPSSAEH